MPSGDKELRRFIHDIRNPIGALIGFAHLLKTREERLSAEQRAQVIDSVLRTTQRLSKMVEDFAEEHPSHRDP